MTITRQRGYKFRIFPTGKQAVFFHRCHGCARKIYNLFVEEGRKRDAAAVKWHEEDPEERKDEHYPYEWKTVAQYKKEFPYMYEVDSLGLANAQLNYFGARDRRFKGTGGSPKFKSKNQYPHAYTTNNQNRDNGKGGTIRIFEDEKHPGAYYLHLPKMKCDEGVRIQLHRPIDGVIKNVTIKYNANGTWTASILVDETVAIKADESPAISSEKLSRLFGGDLGLKCFLTGTDGISYDDPEDYEKLERRLKVEKRKLGKKRARLEKQGRDLRTCKNYQKQRRRVARLEARMSNKRRDFRHKLSRMLVNNHDLLVFEDLNVKGLLKNHCLARGISEASWSDFIRMVEYKAQGEGKLVIKIDRFFASTKTCSCCGAQSGPSGYDGLGIREWVCPECGACHDRDENAAWNILFEGVRLLTMSQDASTAAYWKEVLIDLRAYHDIRIFGDSNLPTVGTAGVARVEDGRDADDLGVNTERVAQACLSADGLGEPGVSEKGRQPTAVSLAVG